MVLSLYQNPSSDPNVFLLLSKCQLDFPHRSWHSGSNSPFVNFHILLSATLKFIVSYTVATPSVKTPFLYHDMVFCTYWGHTWICHVASLTLSFLI